MFWSKRFEVMSDTATVSRIWIAVNLALILGSWLVKKWADKGKSQLTGLFMVAIMSALLIFLSTAMNFFLPAVSFFILYEIFRGAFRPLVVAYIQRYAVSAIRATILSFHAMMLCLGGIIGLFLAGQAANLFSIRSAWWITCGIFCLALLPLFWLSREKQDLPTVPEN